MKHGSPTPWQYIKRSVAEVCGIDGGEHVERPAPGSHPTQSTLAVVEIEPIPLGPPADAAVYRIRSNGSFNPPIERNNSNGEIESDRHFATVGGQRKTCEAFGDGNRIGPQGIPASRPKLWLPSITKTAVDQQRSITRKVEASAPHTKELILRETHGYTGHRPRRGGGTGTQKCPAEAKRAHSEEGPEHDRQPLPRTPGVTRTGRRKLPTPRRRSWPTR